MKKILLAISAIVALNSTVSANDVANDITGPGGTTFFGALHTDNADFTDVFTFNVAGPIKASASLTTVGADLHNIDFTAADLNGNVLYLSPNGFLENGGTLSELELVGPLTLTVKGKSSAAGGVFASYSGTMNVLVLPEPASGALGLTALAAVWGFRRRRMAIDAKVCRAGAKHTGQGD